MFVLIFVLEGQNRATLLEQDQLVSSSQGSLPLKLSEEERNGSDDLGTFRVTSRNSEFLL